MKTTETYHVPVLLQEVIKFLQIKKGGRYIDATLGGGGHTEEILKQGGKVLGIDQDPEAINYAKTRLKPFAKQFLLINANFSRIAEVAKKSNFLPVDGILFDLGVSSHQLETPSRGFSFNQESLLDMRMSPDLTINAGDLVNGLNEKELYELFTKLGEEKYSKRLAGAICRARRIEPIRTTDQLADIVLRNVPTKGRFDRTHPATRIFQALRIAVNDELNSLREALPSALTLLREKGRLAVISFHSLEDKIVKEFIKEEAARGSLVNLTKKPIETSLEEITINPRSRSAKLRVAEIK